MKLGEVVNATIGGIWMIKANKLLTVGQNLWITFQVKILRQQLLLYTYNMNILTNFHIQKITLYINNNRLQTIIEC